MACGAGEGEGGGREVGDDGLGFIVGEETSVVWSVELGGSGVRETQPDGDGDGWMDPRPAWSLSSSPLRRGRARLRLVLVACMLSSSSLAL